MSDSEGLFQHIFSPKAQDAGDYQVSVLFPGQSDRPVMGEFTVQGASVTPSRFNGALSRNIPQQLTLQVQAGKATDLTQVEVQLLAVDQPKQDLARRHNLSLPRRD